MPIIDDEKDDDGETLTLSDASGAAIADAAATGTIADAAATETIADAAATETIADAAATETIADAAATETIADAAATGTIADAEPALPGQSVSDVEASEEDDAGALFRGNAGPGGDG